MTDSSDPRLDAELEALLGFTPVRRRTIRHDGWSPEIQRGFIAALVRIGNVERAAHAVDRTESGAYKVRSSAGAEEFAEVWDKAVALYLSRQPRRQWRGRPPRGAHLDESLPGGTPGQADFAPDDPEAEERLEDEIFDGLIHRYVRKLDLERRCRLEGRVVAADFYVRQLTFIEIAFDLGGEAFELLKRLQKRDLGILDIVATPMSVYLDTIRRRYWAETDGLERPDLPPLGNHDDELSTGEPDYFDGARDGKYDDWRERRDARQGNAAEAQRAWEEKGRREAEARRERLEGPGGGAAAREAKR